MSSVSGRYSRLSAPTPLRHPPLTAGIHPDRPVRAFSQRTAYTSLRAANIEAKKATFAPGGDDASTMAGGPSKIPVWVGPGGYFRRPAGHGGRVISPRGEGCLLRFDVRGA